MSEKLYQIVVEGPLTNFNGRNKIHSKRVFRTKGNAEKFVEEFKSKCIGDGLSDLSHVETVYLAELILEG